MGVAPSTPGGGLAEAAANGDVALLKRLVGEGADVKKADKVRDKGEEEERGRERGSEWGVGGGEASKR